MESRRQTLVAKCKWFNSLCSPQFVTSPLAAWVLVCTASLSTGRLYLYLSLASRLDREGLEWCAFEHDWPTVKVCFCCPFVCVRTCVKPSVQCGVKLYSSGRLFPVASNCLHLVGFAMSLMKRSWQTEWAKVSLSRVEKMWKLLDFALDAKTKIGMQLTTRD